MVTAAKLGDQVIVVVSAMGSTTDELIELASKVSAAPAEREMDMLLTAGERISISLLCMAIIDRGFDAVSFTGSQAGIVTDAAHGRAKILAIRGDRIRESLAEGKIAVVAGFQGVSTERDITTLGRGGSDTSAVALAAALDADLCEIFTDVDGIYTADPRIVPSASKLERISYDEMLELSAFGARVLHTRSVEFARRFRIPLHVRSSFHDGLGTIVQEEPMESAIISGVAHHRDAIKVTIYGVPDQPGVAAKIFSVLADSSINVDMIVQNTASDGHTDVSFTIPKDSLDHARTVVAAICSEVNARAHDFDVDIANVSLVGAGMRTNSGIAAKMFGALADAGINISMISTSTIRISCVVRGDDLETATRAVHDRFGLDDLTSDDLTSSGGGPESARLDG